VAIEVSCRLVWSFSI